MIGTLRGTIFIRRADGIVLEVGGVGYQVNVSVHTLSQLPTEGDAAFLHIYTHVREDAIVLYGFLEEEEKRMFATLLGVTGIGPKVALNVLSGIPGARLIEVIEAEDVASLSRIPGVGKKTASRLILELRERLPSPVAKPDRIHDDVLSALVNLGYRKNVAAPALDRARKEGHKDIETLLKESLKYLTNE
ncbi:MAG: Holliday junction branch migration protein RuvA [Thermodesulfovibrionales bacterium]